MMLAKLLAIAVSILPLIIMATLCRSITASFIIQVTDLVNLSAFEVTGFLLIPYIVLVYCAIYRPIVRFWETLRGKEQPPGGGGGAEE